MNLTYLQYIQIISILRLKDIVTSIHILSKCRAKVDSTSFIYKLKLKLIHISRSFASNL